MERISSLSEKPRIQRPRRLADWLNPAGERKVHSLIGIINSFFEDAPKAHLCESPVRENRTLGLSGGRRLAPVQGASSDPTFQNINESAANAVALAQPQNDDRTFGLFG